MRLFSIISFFALVFAGCSKELAPASPPSSQDKKGNTEAKEQANGLKILIIPVDGAKQSALVILFNIGENHDPVGKSGMAHLIEHLYVTSKAGETAARTVNEFMAKYPGGWNAQTGTDYTVIATVFDKDKLDSELKDAACRMSELEITHSDIDREIPRIEEELANMHSAFPHLAALNLSRERVRPMPDGRKKGGVINELKNTTLDEIRERVEKYYRPSSAILILAGDVILEEARVHVEKYFKEIPAGEPIPPESWPGAPLAAPLTMDVISSLPGAKPMTAVTYCAPKFKDSNYAEFLVIAARMQQKLGFGYGKQFAPATYAVLDDPGTITFMGETEPEMIPEAFAEEIRKKLETAINAPITNADKAAVRNFYGYALGIADFSNEAARMNIYGAAYFAGRRMQLGIDGSTISKNLDAATSETLKKAGEEIFTDSKRSIVKVVPK